LFNSLLIPKIPSLQCRPRNPLLVAFTSITLAPFLGGEHAVSAEKRRQRD